MERHSILVALKRSAALTLALFFVACGSQIGEVRPETRYISVERPAPVPPGVVRYCWEEPIVAFEQRGPGVDVEGRWYNPAYVAVREVRQGRWRPCRPMLSEVKGETKNER